jgi:acetate kinase
MQKSELAGTGLERAGILSDQGRNASARGSVAEIGTATAPVRILVVQTDEELQDARELLATVHPVPFG